MPVITRRRTSSIVSHSSLTSSSYSGSGSGSGFPGSNSPAEAATSFLQVYGRSDSKPHYVRPRAPRQSVVIPSSFSLPDKPDNAPPYQHLSPRPDTPDTPSSSTLFFSHSPVLLAGASSPPPLIDGPTGSAASMPVADSPTPGTCQRTPSPLGGPHNGGLCVVAPQPHAAVLPEDDGLDLSSAGPLLLLLPPLNESNSDGDAHTAAGDLHDTPFALVTQPTQQAAAAPATTAAAAAPRRMYSSVPLPSICDKLLYQYQPVESAVYLDLHKGSRFVGQQTSSNRHYRVEIELLYVDLISSQLCGHLTIHNLTPELPTLITFFESEVIGTKSHSFQTLSWKAGTDIDRNHWSKFDHFRKYHDCFDKPGFDYRLEHEDVVFMRWKERHLVPDHKLSHVHGASFDGFYYVCYEPKKRSITGFYYHNNSELYQKLVVRHEDQRCFGSSALC